jgi:HlyD family secretion protein
VALGLIAGCSGEQDPRVEVAPVGRATVGEVVDAPGSVTARATAALTAPADAVVTEVLVADGAQVEAGAELVRLASPSADAALRQALEAQRTAGRTAVPAPRADLSPLQDQVDAAAAASLAAGREAAAQIPDPALRAQAEQRLVEAEQRQAAASAAARASLRQLGASASGIGGALSAATGGQRLQAGAAVDAARKTIEALSVRAPIAGVVSLGAGAAPAAPAGGDLSGLLERLPEAVQAPAAAALDGGAAGPAGPMMTTSGGLAAGAQLRSGAPVLTVTDLSGLTVDAEVDETDVLLVKAGTPAVVEVDAVPDATYPATVTAVDLVPTTSARGGVSYRVRLALGNGTTSTDRPAPQPRPGMSAVVDLQVRTAVDAIAVPAAAVVRDAGRDAVFVLEGAKVVRREVQVGALGEELVEVTGGLEPGVRVVVRDADRLRDGQAVRT